VPAPCALISLATLDAFMPGAKAAPQAIPSSAAPGDLCAWSRTSGGQTQQLTAYASVFGPPSGIATAQQAYASVVSTAVCHCQGVAVVTQPVTGVGDQAAAQFVTVRPGTVFASLSDAVAPGVILDVRSSNAVIILNYNTITVTGTVLEPREDPALVRSLGSVARGVLASLARPAGASPEPIAPESPEPHYAASSDSCRLITAATLAKYATGATVIPLPNASGSSQPSTCSWGTASFTSIVLTLNLFSDVSGAQQQFDADTQAYDQSTPGVTVTGTQLLAGLGASAAAIFETENGAQVELLVLSGNAELDFTYAGPGGLSPDRATLLAGGIAIARDALAALGRPATSSSPPGPVYASPDDACPLIRASTVAAFLPGATPSPTSGVSTGCGWTGVSGVLNLFVSVYPDPDSALGGYQFDVAPGNQNTAGITFDGERPVRDLGQQATALFETSDGSADLDLYVLSGNAEIELDFSPMSLGGPQPSRTVMLADDVVMAREVLTAMPRT
jgi:hypothetical protein